MNFQTMSRQRKFILIAAVAGLIVMFLPWVTVSAGSIFGGASDNGIGTVSSENGMHGAGIGVFLSFLCAIALSLLGEQGRSLEKTNWLVAMAAGAAALLFTIIGMANTPTDSLGFVKSSIGYGAWIAMLASAGVLASAWIYKNPGDNLKDSLDKLKKDLAFPAGAPPNQGPANGTPTASGGLKAVSGPSHNEPGATDLAGPDKMN